MRPDDDSTPADATDSPTAARPDSQPAGPTSASGGPQSGPLSGPRHGPRHAAPDDAGPRPLIDLSRDPNPGVPDHAAPDDEDTAG